MSDFQISETNPNYRYRLTSTGAGSAKYGKCQVCEKEASEVFMQTEEKAFSTRDEQYSGWTRYQCHDYFGHKDCLQSKQH